MLSSCCLESPTAILPPLLPDCGIIFKFASRQTANIANTNTKCKIWVRDARLENLPIFAESLEQPAHILQLDASVDEIVNMAAIAVIDAQKKQKREQLNAGLN